MTAHDMPAETRDWWRKRRAALIEESAWSCVGRGSLVWAMGAIYEVTRVRNDGAHREVSMRRHKTPTARVVVRVDSLAPVTVIDLP